MTTAPAINPISQIHSPSPSQYLVTSTATTEGPILITAISYFHLTNAQSTSKNKAENQTTFEPLTIVMIVSLVIFVIIIVLIYKMVRRKYKMMIKDAQIQDMPKETRNKEIKVNKDIQRNVLGSGIVIVNVEQDDDRDDELYENHVDKTENGTQMITTKAQESDLEGVSQHFEDAYSVKKVKQHNDELQVHENFDDEGKENKTDYI